MRGGDSREQGEATEVKATKTSGGGGEMPVRHKIPVAIEIFYPSWGNPTPYSKTPNISGK